jgi:hypothetical protein
VTRSADAKPGDLIVAQDGRVSLLIERQTRIEGWQTVQVYDRDVAQAGISDDVLDSGRWRLLTRSDLRALVDPHAEQWIITEGTYISSPVGPFGSYDAAVAHYRANQPQGALWLAEPTIVPLLRPSRAVAADLAAECSCRVNQPNCPVHS